MSHMFIINWKYCYKCSWYRMMNVFIIILRKYQQHIVPDGECVYDNFEHIPPTYTVYNDDLIRYNLEGLSAIYFVCSDECIHHA